MAIPINDNMSPMVKRQIEEINRTGTTTERTERLRQDQAGVKQTVARGGGGFVPVNNNQNNPNDIPNQDNSNQTYSIGNAQFSGTPNRSQQNLVTQNNLNNQINNKPINTVEPVNKPSGFLNKIESSIETQRNIINTKSSRNQINPLVANAEGFGLGLASTGLGLVSTFVHPINTVKGIYQTGKEVLTNPLGVGKQIGNVIENEPGRATGIVVGTYLTGKLTEVALTKGVTKSVDIVRTRNLKEVPMENVVAPEFLKGQKYPQISKGEKAGDLLGEFKQGYGYTASPKPINPSNGVMAGTSELPGLYQSPKLSATFLRVSGEEKTFFSLNPFGTLRPTASEVAPTAFELAPGVKASSSVSPSNLPNIKKFFLENAEKGKSYIPFIKTEKEAVIPFGTKLEQVKTESYFKFEGRRIPIEKFKTVSGESKAVLNDFKTIDEVGYSGYKSVGKKSYVNPLNTLGLSSVSKYSTSKYSSNINSYKSSISKSSYSSKSSSSSITPSSVSYNKVSSGSNNYSPSYNSYPSNITSIGKSSNYSSYSSSSNFRSRGLSYGKTNIINPKVFNNYENKSKRRKPKKYKGISQPIAYTPSLGSSIFNIKLKNKSQLKSGNVNAFNRRGTLGLKDLRKINLKNTGGSMF